jgi:hypothetical protein
MKRLFRAISIAFTATLLESASGADAMVVYNHVSGAPDPLDRMVHERLDSRYKVVDFTDREHSLVSPEGISAFTPPPPVYANDRCVAGSALVIFVISAEGAVVDAFSARSTNEVLAEPGVKSVIARRFTSGQLDGRPVALVAALEIQFTCPEGK